MGLFTSLHFCRPTKPPLITGDDLAVFIRGFAATGAMAARPVPRTVEIKFGEAIDQDDTPSDDIESTSDVIGTTTSIEWDIHERILVSGILKKLERETRPVYRANVELGGAALDLIAHMHRQPTSEGIEEMALDGWFLQLGPIRIASRRDDLEFNCGWIAISLGGPGGMYPSTPRDLVEKAMNHAAVRNVAALCRAQWPVDVRPATPAVVNERSLMRDQWCAGFDVPIDWFWTGR